MARVRLFAADNTPSKTERNAEAAAVRNAAAEVKKRLNVPENLDKFTHETETQYDTVYYRFRWYREKKNVYEIIKA